MLISKPRATRGEIAKLWLQMTLFEIRVYENSWRERAIGGVVPAKAGTHNHRCWLLQSRLAPALNRTAAAWAPAFAGATLRKSKPRALPTLSHPPVVNPVLPRQHALGANRLDGEVARKCHRAREGLDSPVRPRGVLNMPHPRAAPPPLAFQRGRN